jgi:hypothetical protein
MMLESASKVHATLAEGGISKYSRRQRQSVREAISGVRSREAPAEHSGNARWSG